MIQTLHLQAITRCSSMQKWRPPRNPEAETIINSNNGVHIPETRRRSSNQRTLQKCHSDIASVELQGFKDPGFRFHKEGLQENKVEESKQNRARRAWIAQSQAPPIPNWVYNNSAEDMKAQLKFWARAVATNVRQEC